MIKMLYVLRHEFRRHVTRRSFLFAVLGLPLLMALIFVAVIFFLSRGADQPVGIVDQSGLLADPETYSAEQPQEVPFRAFADTTTAESALNQDEIQAYLVVPADYVGVGKLTLYHRDDTYEGLRRDLRQYLRFSLLRGAETAVRERFQDDPAVEFVSLSEEERDNPFTAFVLPFFIGFTFIIAIFTSSGYLIQAVVDEKENRTMEILITSLTPEQLMVGKILGLVGVGLVQIGVWIGLGLTALWLARLNITNFPAINLPLYSIGLALAWFIPFYVLIATLMVAIGISVTAVSEGQQAAGIVSILAMFPLYLNFLIISNPDSPLSVTLSLLPISSPLTMLIRYQVTDVPWRQLALSWVLLVGTVVIALFLVSRLLRVGMLRYGQRLSWREIATTLLPLPQVASRKDAKAQRK